MLTCWSRIRRLFGYSVTEALGALAAYQTRPDTWQLLGSRLGGLILQVRPAATQAESPFLGLTVSIFNTFCLASRILQVMRSC